MNPVPFKGHNAVLAKDQPQYRPLPVCIEHTTEGSVVSCWKLSFFERLKVLFTGRLFFRQLTFGHYFQPILPMTEWKEPHCINCGAPIGDHKSEDKYRCPSKLN
jgi:hypothetical protein